MHFIRPTITNQRLQRFHRWVLLWLTWFAAVIEYGSAFAPLSQHAKTLAHAYLDQIQRLIVAMVMIRAAAQVRRPAGRQVFAEHQRKERGFERALLSVKLWRDLRQRIAVAPRHARARQTRVGPCAARPNAPAAHSRQARAHARGAPHRARRASARR